jgi:hypothetical protein
MSVTLDSTSTPFVRSETFKLSSDGNDCGSKNADVIMAPVVGGLSHSVFGGSLESVCRFCVNAFDRNLAPVAYI